MLAEADPTATRFERVGIGRSYLAPNSEAPNGDGVLPTNGESGYARDGVVAMRPGSTISPSIPDDVAHYTMTPTVEKVLGTMNASQEQPKVAVQFKKGDRVKIKTGASRTPTRSWRRSTPTRACSTSR